MTLTKRYLKNNHHHLPSSNSVDLRHYHRPTIQLKRWTVDKYLNATELIFEVRQ